MECLVCGHKWDSKSYPFKCSKCESQNWDFGNNIKCAICERMVLIPTIHHIDGVHKNNNFKNRIPFCSNCHMAVHQGFGKNKKRLRGYGVSKGYIRRMEFEGKIYDRLVFPIRNERDILNREKLIKTLKNIEYYQTQLKGKYEIKKLRFFNKIDAKNKIKGEKIFKEMGRKENEKRKKLSSIGFFTTNKKDAQIFKLMIQKEKEDNNV